MLLPKNYMRSCRKRGGICQSDLAFILSYKDHSSLSRTENGHRQATLQLVIAYQIIFEISASDLFPQLKHALERSIRSRARDRISALKCAHGETIDPDRIDVLKRIEQGENLNITNPS